MASANNNASRFKVVLLGEGRVGKTSLLLRYVKDTFDDRQISTIQVCGVCDIFSAASVCMMAFILENRFICRCISILRIMVSPVFDCFLHHVFSQLSRVSLPLLTRFYRRLTARPPTSRSDSTRAAAPSISPSGTRPARKGSTRSDRFIIATRTAHCSCMISRTRSRFPRSRIGYARPASPSTFSRIMMKQFFCRCSL